MGYTTEFRGSMTITPALPPVLVTWVNALATTRRMKRALDAVYGIEGEFYVEGVGYRGQYDDATVRDRNHPPSTQPGLWLQWVVREDGTTLEWDGNEKFYEYVDWLAYLYHEVLYPLGHRLEGTIEWRGEDWDDHGEIVAYADGRLCADGHGTYTPATNGGARFRRFYDVVLCGHDAGLAESV